MKYFTAFVKVTHVTMQSVNVKARSERAAKKRIAALVTGEEDPTGEEYCEMCEDLACEVEILVGADANEVPQA